MTIHCIMNVLGGGKTLFLTIMGVIEYNRGRKIFSNYDLAFPHTRLHTLTDIDKMRKGFFLADDFYIWAGSRRVWDSKGVDMILGKSRKRSIDIAWTTTRPRQVDINIRFNTKWVWVPRIIFRGNLPFYMIVEKFEFIPEASDDIDFLGKREFRLTIRPEVVRKAMELYDTEEEVSNLDKE